VRDVGFIRFLFKLWILLSLVGATYALKQEIFGFTAFEQKWLDADPVLSSLYFIDEHWRKFSIFADPVTFSYNMIISSVLCFCLLSAPIKAWKKVVLSLLSILFIVAMVYSGTRGAYILIPAALGLYLILKFTRRALLVGSVLAFVLAVAVYMPTSNPTMRRFQSAFSPSKDASYNVRKDNQKMIQPYILSHPFGGGLGATGVWGQRFSPHSQLANFPPDSGYVRVAVELGWVGLMIFCIFMFVVLYTGITNYYKIQDPELKTFCLAMVLIVFCLHIGNFPQEALVQYPNNLLFYLAIALINATLLIDNKKKSLSAA
jgi:O-antigen ligase